MPRTLCEHSHGHGRCPRPSAEAGRPEGAPGPPRAQPASCPSSWAVWALTVHTPPRGRQKRPRARGRAEERRPLGLLSEEEGLWSEGPRGAPWAPRARHLSPRVPRLLELLKWRPQTLVISTPKLSVGRCVAGVFFSGDADLALFRGPTLELLLQ